MKLSGEIVIDASAERVWDILGHHFAEIGDWATAIDSSRPASEPTDELPGRVCQTGMRAFPTVTDQVFAYDESNRTLSYQATDVPTLIGEARNTWRVTPMGSERARARFDGVLKTRGLAGRLIALPLRMRMRRETQAVLGDLKHFAEHGTPSRNKQRRLAAGPTLVASER